MWLFQANGIPAPKPTPTPRAAPAPKATTKRRAEEDYVEVVGERIIKRRFEPVAKILTEKEELDSPYQISVRVHPDLERFPGALRNALQKACQTAFYTHISTLQAGSLPEYRQTYSIIYGTRVRSESITFNNETEHSNILDLSIANITLLKFFAERHSTMLEKRSFQEQKHMGLTNPKFLELYSVRRGDLGWGLDADGCLSIYASSLIEKKTKEHVWYVQADDSLVLKGEN